MSYLLHTGLSPLSTQLPSVVATRGQQGALPQTPMPQKVLSKESHKDQILNWTEEHQGSGHLNTHGPQEHGPMPDTNSVCLSLVLCTSQYINAFSGELSALAPSCL